MRRFLPLAVVLVALLLPGCPGGGTTPVIHNPPIAQFTYTQANLVMPLSVTFDASRSSATDGTIIAYQWDFGDGTTDIGRQTIHTFPAAAAYTVTLTVVDSFTQANSISRTVNTKFPVGQAEWSYQFAGDANAIGRQPAVGSDGTIYVSVPQTFGVPSLYAVNADGSAKWVFTQFNLTTTGLITDPVFSNGTNTLYVGAVDVGNRQGAIYAFTPAGAVKWIYTLPYGMAIPPGSMCLSYARSNPIDNLYFTAPGDAATNLKARVYKINSNGQLQWTVQSDTPLAALAIGSAGNVYAVNGAGTTSLGADGSVAWEFGYATGTPAPDAIAIGSDETVYVGYTNPAHLVAIGRNTGGQLVAKWTADATGEVGPPTVGVGDVVYCAVTGVGVRAFSPTDGSVQWTYSGTAGSGPITVLDDGTILARSTLGLTALDSTGHYLWNFASGQGFGAAVVAGDGTIYVVGLPPGTNLGATDTYLHAVPGPSPLASAAWPQPRHDASRTAWINGP